MELTLTQNYIEPLPKRKRESFIFKNEGLLISNYKEETSKNFFHSNPKSIYGVKQSVKQKQYQLTSSIDTVLKLSVFVIALLFILV